LAILAHSTLYPQFSIALTSTKREKLCKPQIPHNTLHETTQIQAGGAESSKRITSNTARARREACDLLPCRKSRRLICRGGGFRRAAVETESAEARRNRPSSDATPRPAPRGERGKRFQRQRREAKQLMGMEKRERQRARAYVRRGGRWRMWERSARLMASVPPGRRVRASDLAARLWMEEEESRIGAWVGFLRWRREPGPG
jgi:hypothetical protein